MFDVRFVEQKERHLYLFVKANFSSKKQISRMTSGWRRARSLLVCSCESAINGPKCVLQTRLHSRANISVWRAKCALHNSWKLLADFWGRLFSAPVQKMYCTVQGSTVQAQMHKENVRKGKLKALRSYPLESAHYKMVNNLIVHKTH